MARLAGLLFFVVSLNTQLEAADWPQFRGPLANGTAEEANLPSRWGTANNLRWQVEVPGRGWSSPLVVQDKVFLTTAVAEGEQDMETVHTFQVHCYDLETGQQLWRQIARQGKPRIPTHQANTYASETPVTNGKQLVAYFGMNGVYCYDLQGDLLWEKDLGAYEMEGGWGTASSPVMHERLVFVQVDNEEDSFLVALDVENGEERWRVSRQEGSNWSSPVIWKNHKRTELVVGGQEAISYDPYTGEVYWRLTMGGGSCSSPTGSEHMLVIGGGSRSRGPGPRGGLFAVRAGAAGDITPTDETGQSDGVLWKNSRGVPSMPSPLIYEGLVYIVGTRGGIVSCFSAETGEELYRERLPDSRSFWASPWAYDGKIFCQDDTGSTHVLEAGPEFDLLYTNKLKGQFWASAALVDGAIVMRSKDTLYCISNSN